MSEQRQKHEEAMENMVDKLYVTAASLEVEVRSGAKLSREQKRKLKIARRAIENIEREFEP